MNPVELAEEVEQRYRRYLKTTFYFKDPDLRASFEKVLDSGRLRKGPYLEATPVFKRGETPRSLLESLALRPDEGFLKAIEGDRSLYQHQEEAIRRVLRGRNVVVATGTGSGKTEAFLYPILIHLYREFEARQSCPGVRALVLYPMNALANDQRDRLGKIAQRLKAEDSPFGFTFGQYIGETPKDENDSRRHARDHIADRKPGELVLRSEMQAAPPHILLTNYSMLEYLLLRPDDTPLFDNGQAQWWTFLVLDEAHQYRGSRGIEMGMLLRRLKQRLREGGRTEPFRCIATSATLVGGEGDKAAVARFASDIFGEEFCEDDVILGEPEPIPEPGPETLPVDAYRALGEAMESKNALDRAAFDALASRLGLALPDSEDVSKAVGALLSHDKRAADFRRRIAGNPVEVADIGVEAFRELPEDQQVPALCQLVELLLRAKDTASGAPLLSARYHVFLRSLEGAFVSYWPRKEVFLNRGGPSAACAAFEVALCRECGQHYFVGRIKANKLVEAIRDPGQDDFEATFLRPLEAARDTDEEDDGDGAGDGARLQLCVRCGEVVVGDPGCGHGNSIQVVKEKPQDEERADQLKRCGACGYSAAGRDPVREVVHGTDGPHAVIATTLHQNLPEKRKKVLAFADGRQEAAFFAWYLEDSYRDILSRNLLLRASRRLPPHAPEGLSLGGLAADLRSIFREHNVYPPATGDLGLRRNAWRSVYREFLTDEPRISLEGVGLVRWFLEWPDWVGVPHVFTDAPWSLTEQEARDLALVLLNSMRADRAVEIRTETGVSVDWADLGLQTSQMRIRIGPPRRPRGVRNWYVRSWDGETGKRAGFLVKFLVSRGVAQEAAVEEAVKALRTFWESLGKCEENAPSSRDRLLLPVDDERRLNPDWWRLRPVADDGVTFRCSTCGRLQAVSVWGVCPRHACPGKLEQVDARHLESNHYRLLYQEKLPASLRVEEHTAQLDKEKAREFQREFKSGAIDVLSCSTTFELGVDLGDLDTIFLRNVPPEAFNYAQRVGRAGRRSEPGFAITYCRRAPHDLYHFAEPERMLRGKVRPPVVTLRNQKIITRHIVAVALSSFFRAFPDRFKSVAGLLKDLEHPFGVADFQAFLAGHRAELEGSLRNIVPSDVAGEVGLDDGTWVPAVSGERSRFSLAEAEVSSDYASVKKLETETAARADYHTAKWAQARARTIAEEPVLSFLSRKAVIPKYGFPVDVVELDPQRAQKTEDASAVLLQRDLSIAISEFAPTSQLVANKKLWTSYGLKRVPEKEWDRKKYKRCLKHNVFYRWKPEDPEPPTPCDDRLHVWTYVVPCFGFVTNRDKPEEPRSRTARVFTTRPYFVGLRDADRGTVDIPSSSPLIKVTKASPGWMAVLCEGRRGAGFHVCGRCGAGFKKREKKHRTPHGQDCHGMLERVSLGHEFVTDVLQMQFLLKPDRDVDRGWFAHSLAYAVVDGAADVLEVPSTDLNATVAHAAESQVPPIILYDNVPGGAGLVARLERQEVLRDCLEAAQKRVSGNCGCGDPTSCYGCLRSYRNQFAHQHLQRGPVKAYLDRVLADWR